MSGENYQDLQKFGTNIEKEQKNNSKRNLKIKYLNSRSLDRSIKDHKNKREICCKNKKKLWNTFWKMLKLITVMKQQINKKLNFIADKLHRWERQRMLVFLGSQPKQNLRYKLVETRRQRGNKTIVTRKRIPIKINDGGLQPLRTYQQTLFDFSILDEGYFGRTETVSFGPKPSIWDIPIENDGKTEKRKIFSDLWNR